MVGLKAGRVTLDYPAQPRPVAENFRGRPIFDAPEVHRLRGLRQQLSGARNPRFRCLPGNSHPQVSGPALHLLRTLRGCLPGEGHHHEPGI